MDARHFQALTRVLSEGDSRRRLLAFLGALPMSGGLLSILSSEETDARGRRRRRKKRHKHGKGRRHKRRKRQRRPQCTGLLPTDNLQVAIDAAAEGDTLRLCPGTWTFNGAIGVTKDLTIMGAGPDQTFLDGENRDRVLIIDFGTVVTLQDLTITRGAAPTNGITFGGGISHDGESLTLRNVTVTDCSAFAGGGIENGSGTLILDARSRVTNSLAHVFGGGIHNNGTLFLAGEVTGNEATQSGGGIVNNVEGTLTLQAGSQVTGNRAPSIGGIENYGTVTVEPGSLLADNQPDNCVNLLTGTGCP